MRDYASVKGDIGYHLQIIGDVDEKAKTVSVKSVTRLSAVTAMCVLPKKIGNK